MVPQDLPKGIEEALPPWELDAEAWVFPFWDLRWGRDVSALKLGDGHYHPLEVLPDSEDRFKGGLGAWCLFRYGSSPVGAYDELIYVAGTFSSPQSGTSGLRITNIYVSTEASVWNGRRNWNIPKHVAEFKWSHEFRSDSKSQTVSVYHPRSSPMSSEEPFFSSELYVSSFVPRLPFNTRWMPSLSIIQPPLRAAKYLIGVNEIEADALDPKVATHSLPPHTYRSTTPAFRGSLTLAYSKPISLADGRVQYGDGISFPKANNTFGVGFYMPTVLVGFPPPWEHETRP